MAHLHDLTIKKFHEGLVNKDFSAHEMTQEFFDHIENRNPELNAYLNLTKRLALKQAEEADLKIAKNEPVNVLTGVPLAIKDNILIEGEKATAASKILENYTASYDASVIKKLKKAGSVFLGKTNMDEFAMGSSTENSAFGPTRNPHDISRVPGGSSGGSAAAVAAHMAVAALGSDTGGSVRQPAAFCGVVGLKPTYGAVSRYGLIAMSSSLDQIGPLAKTVEDAAILFQAIAGKDDLDATSVAADYGKELLSPKLEDVKKLKIGIPKEYFIDGLDKNISKKVKEVAKDLESLGLEVKEISLPNTKYSLACYYIIMPAEVSSNLERYEGIRYGERHKAESLLELYKADRELGLGTESKRRILLGAFTLSSGYYDAYYTKAQKIRTLIKKDFERAFKEVDVILTPTTPTPPFKIGEKIEDPLAMYLSDVFTNSANLAGLPAIAIPVRGVKAGLRLAEAGYGHAKAGLPISFQLIGKPWREADILGIGQFYEKL